MNPKRYQSIVKSQTAVAQRVLLGVPTDVGATYSAIHHTLHATGCHHDMHTTRGCLGVLLEAGLITEPEKGLFKRVQARFTTVKTTARPGTGRLLGDAFDNYISQRYGRVSDMLADMAERVDEETGLALLEMSAEITAIQRVQNCNPNLMDVGVRKQLFQQFEPDGHDFECYSTIMARPPYVAPAPAPVEPVVKARKPYTRRIKLSPPPAPVVPPKPRKCDVTLPGVSLTTEYAAWQSLTAPAKVKAWAAKGSAVEPDWQASFKAFLADVGYHPVWGARLQRINKTGSWVRGNVAWYDGGRQLKPKLRQPKNWP